PAIERLPLLDEIGGHEIRERDLVDGARDIGKRKQRGERGREGDELPSAMKEERPIAEAITAKRQAARLLVPRRERKSAQAARHPDIAPALVHAPDHPRVGCPPKLYRRNSERSAKLITIVEPRHRSKQSVRSAARVPRCLASRASIGVRVDKQRAVRPC